MGRREQLIKELVLSRVAKCGQCGGQYHLSDVNVLGSKEDLWFLMLVCGRCHQAVGVAAVVKEQTLAAADEKAKAARRESATPQRETKRERISAADVAAVHDFLQGFDGDFKRLFLEQS